MFAFFLRFMHFIYWWSTKNNSSCYIIGTYILLLSYLLTELGRPFDSETSMLETTTLKIMDFWFTTKENKMSNSTFKDLCQKISWIGWFSSVHTAIFLSRNWKMCCTKGLDWPKQGNNEIFMWLVNTMRILEISNFFKSIDQCF